LILQQFKTAPHFVLEMAMAHVPKKKIMINGINFFGNKFILWKIVKKKRRLFVIKKIGCCFKLLQYQNLKKKMIY
jgi:hypothetical protein